MVTSGGWGEEADAFEERHAGTPKEQVIPVAYVHWWVHSGSL